MSENTEFYKELAAACTARSQTYQLLARLFRKEVNEELLAELAGKKYPYGTGNDKADAGYLKIATFLSNTWPNTVTDLAVDRCEEGPLVLRLAWQRPRAEERHQQN